MFISSYIINYRHNFDDCNAFQSVAVFQISKFLCYIYHQLESLTTIFMINFMLFFYELLIISPQVHSRSNLKDRPKQIHNFL
jgi:hypothetical protein